MKPTPQAEDAPRELTNFIEADGRTVESMELLGQIPGPGVTFFALGFTLTQGGPTLLGIAGGYIGDSLKVTGHTYTIYEQLGENLGEQATALIARRDKELMSQAGDLTAPGRSLASETTTVLLAVANLTVPEIDGVEISVKKAKFPQIKAIAERAYLWPNAVQEASKHTTIVTITTRGGNVLERSTRHAQITARLSQDPRVVAIVANETVYEPAFYREVVQSTPEGYPPVLTLVHLGLAKEKGTLYGFTKGLDAFGKDEFLLTGSSMEKLQHTLFELASHVIMSGNIMNEEVSLSSGETLTLEREGEGDTAVLTGSLT